MGGEVYSRVLGEVLMEMKDGGKGWGWLLVVWGGVCVAGGIFDMKSFSSFIDRWLMENCQVTSISAYVSFLAHWNRDFRRWCRWSLVSIDGGGVEASWHHSKKYCCQEKHLGCADECFVILA